ncbi:unnamed protein product, partial [Closterium sp. Naga37s-1]
MTCEVFELKELVGLLHTIMFHRALGLVRPKSIDSELFDITYVQCGDAEVERQIEEKIGQFSLWLEKNPTKKGQICLSFFEKRRPITSSSSSATSSGSASGQPSSSSSSPSSSSSSSPAHASAVHTTAPTTTAPSTTAFIGTLPSPSPSPSHSFSPMANASATNSATTSRPATGLSVAWQHHQQQGQQGQQQQQQQQRSSQLEADVREALLSILTMANEKRDHLPPVLTSSLVSFPFEISVPSLTAGEIAEQLLLASQRVPIRNVVFMGMGEPFNNHAAVKAAVELMVAPHGFHMSPKHITVSTVGVVPHIRSFASAFPSVNLALSLHAPSQSLRVSIVPSARAYSLDKLMGAVDAYQKDSGRRVFIEYILLGGVNDSITVAHELGLLLQSRNV